AGRTVASSISLKLASRNFRHFLFFASPRSVGHPLPPLPTTKPTNQPTGPRTNRRLRSQIIPAREILPSLFASTPLHLSAAAEILPKCTSELMRMPLYVLLHDYQTCLRTSAHKVVVCHLKNDGRTNKV
ncbi:hypothetical protein X777_15247, partial [Ooceraea biroi]